MDTAKKTYEYILELDENLDGWVIYAPSKYSTWPAYITQGSQKQGTQVIKVWKTEAAARRYFERKYQYPNPYSPIVNVLVKK